jgi:hypothetical protein
MMLLYLCRVLVRILQYSSACRWEGELPWTQCLEYPELVRAVVAVGSGTNEPDFTDPFMLNVLAAQQDAAERGNMHASLEAFLQFVSGPYREHDEINPGLVRKLHTMAQDILTTHLRPESVQPTHVHSSWERLVEMTVTVLAVLDELDTSDHLKRGLRLAVSVPDGQEALIANTAH